ncbi:hypothetical protein ACHAWF_002759 [Thalassiosira exigua]
MVADDPFACFGSDDDSDSDSDADSRRDDSNRDGSRISAKTSPDDAAVLADRDRARNLMENYNNGRDRPSSGAPSSKCSPAYPPFLSSYEDQRSRAASLPWPQRQPLYLGPMALSDTLREGGGRGYVAAQDLPPGTCVLIEEPFVKGWSEQQMGRRLGLESIQYLLERDNAAEIVEYMEELHPGKDKVDAMFQERSSDIIDELDRKQIVDMMAEMNSETSHVDRMETLVMFAKDHDVTNCDGSPLTAQDINRLLLTLRYNGFDSGLYLHFSMFNHNEDPNVIKFRPGEKNPRDGYYSEARTTRHVRKGEALTLHYLENPREVSHATRRTILWNQHRFDIGDEFSYRQFLDMTVAKTGHLFNDNERGNNIFESELVSGKFPPSIRDGSIGGEGESPSTSNIEKTLDDLENMLVELQSILKAENHGTLASSFDRAAELELTVCELTTASQSTLNNNQHILLSRCRRLHIDVIDILLSHCATLLNEKQSIELMARFLPSVQQLLQSQCSRLGNDHPDVARTYNDFSMAIQAMLSHSPKRLLALNLNGLKTLDQCSKMENECRMEKKRIELLYPRDVDMILDRVKQR